MKLRVTCEPWKPLLAYTAEYLKEGVFNGNQVAPDAWVLIGTYSTDHEAIAAAQGYAKGKRVIWEGKSD